MRIGVIIHTDEDPRPVVCIDEMMDFDEEDDDHTVEDSMASSSSTVSITLEDLTIHEINGSQIKPYLP